MNALLKELIDNDRKYDPWGAAMATAFAVCDVLTVLGEGQEIPAEMQYRPAMGLNEETLRNPEESYQECEILTALDAEELSIDDLAYALGVIDRYLDLLKLAGRDY